MICKPGVKLNFGLSVLRRREDGYHDLETLFVPCPQFHDTLEIVTGDGYSETSARLFSRYGPLSDNAVSGGVSGCDEDCAPQLAQRISPDGKLMITIARAEGINWDPLNDLTAKAYRLLAADFNLPPVKIFLEKTSPVGAGLGGGSADAAFALNVLNENFSLGLSQEQLASYAARLGSDTAFFIFNKPMFGTGRGELLSPLDSILDGAHSDFSLVDYDGTKPQLPYEVKVIAPEGIAVSTADAYKGIVTREATSEGKTLSLSDALKRPISEWKNCLVNDFEKTVFVKHPELDAIKKSLYDSGAIYASMSGSGSALFAIYSR